MDQSTFYRFCLALFAGIALGLFYFAGLWLTVRFARNLRHKLPLVYLSLVARLAVVFVALYIIMDSHLERLASALLGFYLARTLIIPQIRLTLAKDSQDRNSELQSHRQNDSRVS